MSEDSKPVSNNYPGNSYKGKAEDNEPKRQSKVILGDAIERKKPIGRRLVEAFTGDDVHSVGSYLLMEVLVPATKNLISDMASQGVERMLFGEVRSRYSSSSRNGSHISYNRMYPSGKKEDARGLSRGARASHDFREIILQDRSEAEAVLDGLSDVLQQYDQVRVSDLYDLVGITGSFTDDRWGWNDLRAARSVKVREGYLLDLPRPIPL